MHRLLQRQLNRFAGNSEAAPVDWTSFVKTVDAAYIAADEDLHRAEHSLEQMSNELNERNDNLRAEITQRLEIEEQLKSSIRQLKRKNEQISQLNSMGDKLQSCRSLESAYHIIADALQKLFLTQAGLITIHDEVSNTLLSVATWGDKIPSNISLADDKEMIDRHLRIELSTHGHSMGVIDVILKKCPSSDKDEAPLDEQTQLVQATSDHISLALANLKLQESLRQQTIRDPLTGLYNRRHMEVSLEREASRAQRAVKPLGIIMLDIDHFKRFNDNFGHQAGDAVLTALGAFLNRQIRGEDIPCRYGGEEFILILPGADLINTQRRAEQICKDVQHTLNVIHEGKTLGEITVSVGVSCFPSIGRAPQEVIKAADDALYTAKSRGRNQVVVAR